MIKQLGTDCIILTFDNETPVNLWLPYGDARKSSIRVCVKGRPDFVIEDANALIEYLHQVASIPPKTKQEKMVEILAAKLTQDQLIELSGLMDEPPDGPFYDALNAYVKEIAPELFVDDVRR